MSKVDDALICKANQSGVQNLVNANNPRRGFQHLTGAAFSEKGGIKLKAKKYDYSFLFHPFFGKNSEREQNNRTDPLSLGEWLKSNSIFIYYLIIFF